MAEGLRNMHSPYKHVIHVIKMEANVIVILTTEAADITQFLLFIYLQWRSQWPRGLRRRSAAPRLL